MLSSTVVWVVTLMDDSSLPGPPRRSFQSFARRLSKTDPYRAFALVDMAFDLIPEMAYD